MDTKSTCISMAGVTIPSIWEVLSSEIPIFLVSCVGILLWQGTFRHRRRPCRATQNQDETINDQVPYVQSPEIASELKGALKNKNMSEVFRQLMAMQTASQIIPVGCLASLCRAAVEQDSAEKLVHHLLPGHGSSMVDAEGLSIILEEAAKLRSPEMLTALHTYAPKASICMSTASWEALIRGYASLGHLRNSHSLFEEMLAKGMEPSESTMVAILNACAETKEIRLAESIMEHCRKHHGIIPLGMYAALMKVYSNAKSFRKVCDLHVQMEKDGITPDDTTYGHLIRSAAETGRLAMARRLFRESGNPDLLNYMSLIRAAGKERDVSKAMSLLQHLEHSGTADTTAYNCVLDVCVACSDHQAAQGLFQRIQENGMIDVISFNIILKSILQTDSWEAVEKLLKDMKSQGICPNKVTYNSLMHAAISKGQVDQAWELVDRMESEGVDLDACTCSTLMKCVKISKCAGDVERVLALIERTGVVLDEVLIDDLFETCVRFGDKEGNLLSHVLQVLKAIGAQPPSQAVASLIKRCSHSGQMDQAWVVWRELTVAQQLALDQSLYTCMAEACVSNGDLGGALQVFRALKLAFPSSPAKGAIFSMLIKSSLQRKQAGLAMELYEDMDQDTSVCCSLVTYNTLIDAFARAGDMVAVGKVFMGMCRHGVEPDLITYSTAIKGYCVRGDLETAIRLLGQMREKGIEPDAVLYNSLLDGCAHQQLRKLTEQVLADMEGPGGIAPSNYTLSILVKLYGRCKDMHKVREVVETYPEQYSFSLNAKVYTCLMSAFISAGQLTEALEVFQQMKSAGCTPDAKTYQTILSGCLRQGNVSSAVLLVDAALDSGYFDLESFILQEVLLATARINRAADLGLPLFERLSRFGISFPGRIKAALQEAPGEPESCRSFANSWRRSRDRKSVV